MNRLSIIVLLLLVLVGCVRHPMESMNHPIKFRNKVTNPTTGDTLAELAGWIYLQGRGTVSWAKLIPGRCPQWTPNSKRFYYFLDLGYDGVAQLWSADEDGEARFRISTSDYWIWRSPVISKDGKKLAWHYSSCHASNFVQDIKVVTIGSIDSSAEAKVVLRYPEGTQIGPIKWDNDNWLSVEVNGKVKRVDTTKKGREPIP